MANAQELLQSLLNKNQVPDAASLLANLTALSQGQPPRAQTSQTGASQSRSRSQSTGAITDETGTLSLNQTLSQRVNERFSPEEQVALFGGQPPDDRMMWLALNDALSVQHGIQPGAQTAPILGGLFGGNDEFALRQSLEKRQAELTNTLDRVKEKTLLKDLERGQELSGARDLLGTRQGDLPAQIVSFLDENNLLQRGPDTLIPRAGPVQAPARNPLQDIVSSVDPTLTQALGIDEFFGQPGPPRADKGLEPVLQKGEIDPDAPLSDQALLVGSKRLETDLATQRGIIPQGSTFEIEQQKHEKALRKLDVDELNTLSQIKSREQGSLAKQQVIDIQDERIKLSEERLKNAIDQQNLKTIIAVGSLLGLEGEELGKFANGLLQQLPGQPGVDIPPNRGFFDQFFAPKAEDFKPKLRTLTPDEEERLRRSAK